MPDYSKFPFDAFSTDELRSTLTMAVEAGDTEFADALREQIKQRKPEDEDVERTKPDFLQLFNVLNEEERGAFIEKLTPVEQRSLRTLFRESLERRIDEGRPLL